MTKIAHFSDLHLKLPSLPFSKALSKRLLGFLSWHWRRRQIHDHGVLPVFLQDLSTQPIDHMIITGDLINISLEEEYINAHRWLENTGSPDKISIIPGNHDCYVPVLWEKSLGLWSRYMTNDYDQNQMAVKSFDDFPYLRIKNNIAIIGVSSARPMPLSSAAGIIGTNQLTKLAHLLDYLKAKNLFKIILIHHPPFTLKGHERKQLQDISAFIETINPYGVHMIVHGHTHRSGLTKINTDQGYIPVVGVPSISSYPVKNKPHARYHIYTIIQKSQKWFVDVEVRGYNKVTNLFNQEGRFTLAIP
ncbi:MAG: metallophosphoesterase [Alphaproteobacteria bacterium]|nr:metallophosphoesterase [Alphaproteobacteria bacterium]